MVRKLKPKREPQTFTRRQRIRDHVPAEAGDKGETVARASAIVLEHLMQTAPFELAVVALAIVWRNDKGDLVCIPTIAGADASAVPAAAAAFRGIADGLDAGEYDTVVPGTAKGGDA